jgi:tetratricopeptide (TPR) repeat protein
MRIFLIAFNLILFAAGLAMPALAQEAGAADSEAHAEAVTPLSEENLDGLFTRLSRSEDENEAKSTEAEILRRFYSSGSDTTDLLMSWANRAIKDEDYPVALDILDRIVILQTDFVEGWNKRATVHYLRGDYGKAIADIEKTLALEPRHFGALSGLGLILRDMGETRQALHAFQEALKVHPHLKNAQDMLKTLRSESGDRDA